jgi:hypothetical protein
MLLHLWSGLTALPQLQRFESVEVCLNSRQITQEVHIVRESENEV